MILISHRGNLNGPQKDKENSPAYILEACNAGFDVEIDVWCINNKFYLGHDNPDYLIDEYFLLNDKFWCHAKNVEALLKMNNLGIHCFWHQQDDYTLTSRKFIWTYPGKKIITQSIAVIPENVQFAWDISNAEGICSDYIQMYKDK